MPNCYAAAALLTGFLLVQYKLWDSVSPRQRGYTRTMLPPNLPEWRLPGSGEAEERIWRALDGVFRVAGYVFWRHQGFNVLTAPDGNPSVTGFGYFVRHRSDPKAVGGLVDLQVFQYKNPLCRAARTRDRLDVIVRVIGHGSEGQDHLRILRRIATDSNSLRSDNHALPMFQEFQLENITFGIFPKIGARVADVYGAWAKNSVGDIIDILMQMLEALTFIHQNNIAHRDAYHDNFLIQWHPESLATNTISPTRPRVYLTDFEVAVEFQPESPMRERLCTGLPFSDSFLPDQYCRPHAPEFASGKPYNPFKLDVWQVGFCFSQPYFKTTVSSIDEVLMDMTDADPIRRSDAQESLDRLRMVAYSMAPNSLLIKPYVTES